MKYDFLPRNKALKPFAKRLRRAETPEEKTLWYQYLRTYPLRFNRQRIIGNYIADFYCDKAKLVIELDGSQHFEETAEQYDQKRTAYFESIGIQVLRFTNREIQDHLDGVCHQIDETIAKRTDHDPFTLTDKEISAEWQGK
jgi:very-short-patch-repair endonuclease